MPEPQASWKNVKGSHLPDWIPVLPHLPRPEPGTFFAIPVNGGAVVARPGYTVVLHGPGDISVEAPELHGQETAPAAPGDARAARDTESPRVATEAPQNAAQTPKRRS
jgi:hypothetical protein